MADLCRIETRRPDRTGDKWGPADLWQPDPAPITDTRARLVWQLEDGIARQVSWADPELTVRVATIKALTLQPDEVIDVNGLQIRIVISK